MQDWKVGNGESVSASWPSDASIHLRKTSGRKLADVLGTITNTLFVSRRFQATLEQFIAPNSTEFLPVKIFDHRKRIISEDHVIANPLGTFDCLDLEASKVLWHPEKPDTVVRVRKAVLSARKIEVAPPFFRIKNASTRHVVTSEPAKALYAAKMTNLYWDQLEVK